MSDTDAAVEQECINTIRTLAMDAVQAANSGHPGAPMALAPVTYTLWQRFLRFDPADPIWPNRDRFVLSNGHASMLLYSMLHLAGVKAVNAKYEKVGRPAVSLAEIKRFRQIDSHCPGHPEYRWTSGVETTTGPLGQGLATSVGMSMASRWVGSHFNRPGFSMVDYDVYSICGDGCLMEGISNEAASLAGHLKLSNLCWIYDNNHITIEGNTSLAFSDDVATRFLGLGWNVTRVSDANDVDRLTRALETFRATHDRPTLIIVDSHIAYGAPTKQDTAAAHGEPLGEEEIRGAKESYGWPAEAKFRVPAAVRKAFNAGIGKRGRELNKEWLERFKRYEKRFPKLADQLKRMEQDELPDGWDKDLPVFPADEKGMATRVSSGKVLNAVAKGVPWLVGGAADLAPSTKTRLTDDAAGDFEAGDPSGRNLHFGVREHAMGAAMNGMALSKIRPFGSGFLVFSDYGRPAIRLASMMELPVIYVFTHDSIGLGEDGPTHQPIEHLASLRAIPGVVTLRPGDANEVSEAWRVALSLEGTPVILAMSRQNVPTLDRSDVGPASGLAKGAYVLKDFGGKPDVLLIGTGSEVALCLDAGERLYKSGIACRIVSMPSWELFERQTKRYRDSVLPPDVTARVSVEQAATFGWERWVGTEGASVGMTTFGASAPIKDLLQKFGFTVDNVVATARAQVRRSAKAQTTSRPATKRTTAPRRATNVKKRPKKRARKTSR